jgi:hypothetical protein
VNVVTVLVLRATLKDGPRVSDDVPTFFKVRLNVAPPSGVPEGVPSREKETSWRDGTEVAEPMRPMAADATTPPTARTTPMMMKRSRDWEMARRAEAIFIVREFGLPI